MYVPVNTDQVIQIQLNSRVDDKTHKSNKMQFYAQVVMQLTGLYKWFMKTLYLLGYDDGKKNRFIILNRNN